MHWRRHYRLLPSRYPPIDLFERVGDPEDWETIAAIEGLTNDRLRDEAGDLSLVPVDERVSGPGASVIMAAFTHIGIGTRFSDGTFGVYYASKTLDAAIHEVAYHHEQFLKRTAEPKIQVQMRNYIGAIRSNLYDIRGSHSAAHDPDSYAESQRLAIAIREAAGNGIVYDCVRLSGAENIAVFRPKVLSARRGKAHVTQGPHLFMDWDGARITRYLIAGENDWHPL